MKFLKFLLLSILLFTIVVLNAHFVKDMPCKLTQPNGDTVNCFIAGDEYYRRVYDENGFTIVQNKQTGYYVYAVLKNDNLVATNYIVRQVNPASVGLMPKADISSAKKFLARQSYWQEVKQFKGNRKSNKSVASASLRTGTLNNITIYIDFQGQQFSHTKSQIENLFSNPANGTSLYSYYHDFSGGNFNIVSTFYPETAGNVVYTYTAPQPRGYYQIQSTTNTIGYDENDSDKRRQREHQLLYDAIMSIKSQIEADFTGSMLDMDDDGYIDNISFVIQDGSGDMVWSNAMFWPHRWGLYTPYFSGYWGPENNFNEYPTINGKYAYDYFLITENHLFSVGNGQQSVLVHEMGHVLGAPDFYCGYCEEEEGDICVTPMGYWEIMASNQVPPQSAGAFVTSVYWQFIDPLPEITQSGIYTVYHSWDRTSDHNTGYKIMSPNSAIGEYFVIDYRKKTGTPNSSYDSGLYGEGLIITRVNPAFDGNIQGANGENFGAYIFRPEASDMFTEGSLSQAFFSNQSGRTVFSDNSNPPAFLSDNSVGFGGIVIDQISNSGGDSMTFRVTFPCSYPIVNFNIMNDVCENSSLDLTSYIDISDYSFEDVLSLEFYSDALAQNSISQNTVAQYGNMYYVVLTANGCTSETTQIPVNINIAPIIDTIIQDGLTLTVVTSENNLTFEWSTGETIQNIEIESIGTYIVTVTNNSGCETVDTIIVYTIGINNNFGSNQLPVSIYPNPNTGKFLLELTNFKETVNYIITDEKGKAVSNGKIEKPITEINLPNIGKSIYFIQFDYNNKKYSEKIIIK